MTNIPLSSWKEEWKRLKYIFITRIGEETPRDFREELWQVVHLPPKDNFLEEPWQVVHLLQKDNFLAELWQVVHLPLIESHHLRKIRK